MCACRGLFGDQCSFEQVRKELAEYSDFALHSFAAAHGKAFAKFLLPAERVRDAAKCRFLARLLPELKASLFAWFISHSHSNSSCTRSISNLTKYALQREPTPDMGLMHGQACIQTQYV